MASALPTLRTTALPPREVVYLFGTFVSLLYRSLADVETRVHQSIGVIVLKGILEGSKEVRIQIVLGDYGGADALGAIILAPPPCGFIGFVGRAAGHFATSFSSEASAWARKSVRASAIAASLATTTGRSLTVRFGVHHERGRSFGHNLT